MKKTVSILLLALALFTFNGCGDDTEGEDNLFGGGDDSGFDGGDDNGGFDDGSSSSSFVNLSDLSLGYNVIGYNSADQSVSVVFCLGDYEYIRGQSSFAGSFNIKSTHINFFDDAGGSYSLETGSGELEVGQNYNFAGLGTDITIDSFTEIVCQ